MMNHATKLTLALCIFMLSAAGCSKNIIEAGANSPTATFADEPEVTVEKINVARVDNRLQNQEEVVQDVISIPKEDNFYEHIKFSDEQSVSVVLPEYYNMDIDDISLLLTKMDTSDFHYPTANTSYVTSPYGWRHGRMHAGVDLKVNTGDNIYAAFGGVVRVAKYNGAYGYCIVIRHNSGIETLYAHSSKMLVEVNDVVEAGQIIALGGNTGRSTGSHLHFEVRVAGNYINPNLVIDTKNHSLQDNNLYITRRNNRVFASTKDSTEEREADIIEQLSIKYHIVRSGDVLSRIAVNNHTTVSSICKLNNISSRSTLRIGQRLIVRDGIRPTTSQTKQTAVATSGSTSTYTVKQGDTLSAIAQRNNTTVSSICTLNNISPSSTLRIGQRLTISDNTYIVKSGDTLSGIAAKNNTSVSALCQLNNISTNTTLRIGQRLRVS